MPYIAQENRKRFDPVIELLAELITKLTHKRAGDLNYIFTKLLLLSLLKGKPMYCDYNEAIGVLECCKLELYRRGAAPYEDKAIAKNGDIKPWGVK